MCLLKICSLTPQALTFPPYKLYHSIIHIPPTTLPFLPNKIATTKRKTEKTFSKDVHKMKSINIQNILCLYMMVGL